MFARNQARAQVNEAKAHLNQAEECLEEAQRQHEEALEILERAYQDERECEDSDYDPYADGYRESPEASPIPVPLSPPSPLLLGPPSTQAYIIIEDSPAVVEGNYWDVQVEDTPEPSSDGDYEDYWPDSDRTIEEEYVDPNEREFNPDSAYDNSHGL